MLLIRMVPVKAQGEIDALLVNVGPESSALLAARRATVVLLAGAGAIVQILTTLSAWSMLTVLEVAGTAFALAFVVLGSLVRRANRGMWILAAGAWTLVLLNVLPGAGGPWLLINSAAIFGALAIGLVAPLWGVFAGAVVLPLVLHLAWAAHPGAVVATGYAVLGGWVPPLQVASVLVVVGLVWHRAMREATLVDTEFERARLIRDRLLADHARQLARRRTVVRVHETLLNTIKCTLDPHPSEEVLRTARAFSTADLIASTRGDEARTLRDVVLMAVQPWVLRVETSFDAGADDRVSGLVGEVLGSALGELLRNAFRYETDPSVKIAARSSSSDIVVTVTGIGLPESEESLGIGIRDAVRESLKDLEGTVHEAGGAVTITVPRVRTDVATKRKMPGVFVRSRALMAALLLGTTLGGSPYLFSLAFAGGHWLPTAGILMATLVLMMALAFHQIRQRRMSTRASIGLLALASVIPWLAASAFGQGCGGMGTTLASALNLSGLMLVAVSLWGRPWLLGPGLIAWGTGVAFAVVSVPEACAASIPTAIVNSLIIIPVVVVGISIAARAFVRSRSIDEEARELEVTTRASMAANEELLADLADLEKAVVDVFSAIGNKARVDDDDRRVLRSLDARIRMSLQVDRTSDGALPTLAARLVTMVTEHQGHISVRGIDHSPDRRPVDAQICEVLERAALGLNPLIGMFFDGSDEHLFLATSLDTSEVPEPGIGGSLNIGDAMLSIDAAPGGSDGLARIVVRVSRHRVEESLRDSVHGELQSVS